MNDSPDLPDSQEESDLDLLLTSAAGASAAFERLYGRYERRATEAQIRAVLRALDAHIIDGPGASGAYLIELSSADPKAVSGRLQGLRSRTDVVQSIDVALP